MKTEVKKKGKFNTALSKTLVVVFSCVFGLCIAGAGIGNIFAAGTATFSGLGTSGETVYVNEAPGNVSVTVDDAEQFNVSVSYGSSEVFTQDIDNGDYVNLSGVVTSNGKYEITAAGTDSSSMAFSETLTFYYDTENPTINVTGVKDKDALSTNPTIKVNVSDAIALDSDQTSVTLNGADITADATGSSGYAVTDEGSYTLAVEATDKAGNTQEKTISFSVDRTKPNISITGDNNGYVKTLNNMSATSSSNDTVKVEITATNENGDELKKTVDGTFAQLSGDSSDTVSGEKWTITATATDKAGNTASTTKEVIKDNKLPVISFEGAENGKYYKDTVTLKGIVEEDNIDTCTMDVKLNGSSIGNSYDLERTLTKDGKYDATLRVTDKCGQNVMQQITFYIDTKAPEISFSGQAKDGADVIVATVDKGYYAKILNVTATSNEKADLSMVVDPGSVTKEGDTSVKYESFEEDGTYSFSVVGTDEAGNVSAPYTYSVIKDSKDPVITVSGIDDGAYYNHDVTVTATAEDQNLDTASMNIKFNGTPMESTSLTQKLSKEGTYELTVTARDKAGNTATSKTYTFYIDKTPPKTSFSGESNNSYRRSPDGVTASANEEAAVKLSVTKDGSAFKSDSGNNSVTFKDYGGDGEYVFSAYSVDLAGNVGETVKWTVTKDTTDPVVKISGVEDGKYYNYDVTPETTYVEINMQEATMTVYRDGNELSNKELRQTLSAEGKYEIVAKVVDKAGNSATKKVSFVIDKTPPKTTLSGVEKNKHYKSVPTVTAKSNEPATVYMTVTRDGNVVYSGNAKNEKAFSAFDKDGDYVVSAYSIDLATNKGETTTISFVKDSTAPIITLSGATEGAFHNTTRNIAIKVHERYYKTNKVEVSAYYTLHGKRTNIPFTFKSTGIDSINHMTCSNTGEYHITVTAVDEAGNVADKKTLTFKVDTKKPEIEITIPNKVSAYNDAVTPKVTIKDDYFKSKTITIKKMNGVGAGTTQTKAFKDDFGTTGGTRIYYDFAKQKINDGAYLITAVSEDKAGNVTTKSMEFMVDRFGSVFKLVSAPKDKYIQELKDDIVIREMNVSKIRDYKVIIRQDSNTLNAEDVTTTKEDVYTTYTIPAENFSEEGFYKVNVRTVDAAGNISESEETEGCEVFFAVDRTPPTIMATGVESRKLYKESSVRMNVSATDTISEDVDITVKVNGEEERIRSDEKGSYVTIKGGYNQDIVIEATDQAGNVEKKEFENVSVSKSVLAPFYANKGLMAGAAGGAGALLIGGVYLLARHRRKTKPQDDIVF